MVGRNDMMFHLKRLCFHIKGKNKIFQLRDNALNWWGNLERQLHLTPDTVSWELFEERFQEEIFVSLL
jgi:hypothetical protein